MNKFKWIFIIAVFALSQVFSPQIKAGAWTQKKGSGFYKLSFRYLNAKKFYDMGGTKFPITSFKDISTGVYGEYGITNNFTITGGAIIFKSVGDTEYFNNGSPEALYASDQIIKLPKESGFGDVFLGGKYKLYSGKQNVISTSVMLNIPTGNTDNLLWLGQGDFQQRIQVEYGHSFYPKNIYATGGVAFNNRNDGFSDELFVFAEAGYNLFEELLLIARIHTKRSLDNGNESVRGGLGIYENNQEYIAYNLELFYKVSKSIGLSFLYESGTKGKNIVSAPVMEFGISFSH